MADEPGQDEDRRQNEDLEGEQAPAQETQNPAKEGPETTPMGQTDEEQDEEGTTAPGGR